MVTYALLWVGGLLATYYWATSDNKTVDVVVIGRDTAAYTILDKEWLLYRSIPVALFHEGMVRDIATVAGRYSLWPMFSGEFLHLDRLVEEHSEELHDSGRVVIRIPVQNDQAPAHLLQPGNEIGLIQVTAQRFGDNVEGYLFMPRVRLVGVQRNHDDSISSVDLSVNEHQATEIATAVQSGKLFIIGRNGPGTEQQMDTYHSAQRLPIMEVISDDFERGH